MRRVPQDPAEFGDFAAQRVGDRRLLRRRVEHLPALAPVVVHLDAERVGQLLRRALQHRPVVPGPPPDRQVRGGRPSRTPQPGRVALRSATVNCVLLLCEGPGRSSSPAGTNTARQSRRHRRPTGDTTGAGQRQAPAHSRRSAPARRYAAYPRMPAYVCAGRGALLVVAGAWPSEQAARSLSARTGWVRRVRGVAPSPSAQPVGLGRGGGCRRGGGLGRLFFFLGARGGEYDHRGDCGATRRQPRDDDPKLTS